MLSALRLSRYAPWFISILFLPFSACFVVNTGSLRYQVEHEKPDTSITVACMCESAATAGKGLDELRKLQREQGGIFGDISYDEGHKCENVLISGFEAGLPGELRAEKVEQAVDCGTLLVDKSHYGVICVQGHDRMRFLHSQGTNAFDGASKGTAVPTCFTTNVGRVVDFCEGVVLDDEVWLLSSPHRWEKLLSNMDKFIFPMDKTTVSSLSEELAVFFLTGPEAAKSLSLAGCNASPKAGNAAEWKFEGRKVVVLGHSRSIATKTPGIEGENHGDASSQGIVADFTVVAPWAASAKLWSALSELPDVVVAGEEDWQHLRIKQGLPFPGKELTNEYNPLEAGLWHSVHFDKGCYIGQETISRLNAYNGVKKVLQGVSFNGEDRGQVCEGDALIAEENGARAGVVTSLVSVEDGDNRQGLAYIRTQAGGVGLKVMTKDTGVRGTVTHIPYPTRSDAESAQPPRKKEGVDTPVISAEAEDEKVKEAARKAAKMEAMQKKLDALKKARSKAA